MATGYAGRADASIVKLSTDPIRSSMILDVTKHTSFQVAWRFFCQHVTASLERKQTAILSATFFRATIFTGTHDENFVHGNLYEKLTKNSARKS